MASLAYDSYLPDVFAGNIQAADTYYVMLTTDTYEEDRAAHNRRDDVTNEVVGTGYTAGGQAVVPTFTNDTTNHRLTIVFPTVTWPSSTITARKAVYYKRRGGAASADELVAVNDFGASDVVTSATTFTLNASTMHINAPAA
ncbi:MAG: hypothetical protein V4684_19335 [Pseudomonadota bacterium]